MSRWKWRLWVIGWARSDVEPYIIDMGHEAWLGWKRLFLRLYWSNPVTNPTRHMGEYWEHPSLDWYHKANKNMSGGD